MGLTAEQADQRVADMIFAFEPGDLISETMSLGAPAPIEVVVSGRNLAEASTYMDRLREQFDGIDSLRDVQIQQSLHYPTVQVTLDRERAGLSGVTARDIGESLIAATYSSRYTTRIFWRDDVSGNSYQVQVQVPPPRMTEATDVELVPLLPASRPRSARADPGNALHPQAAALDPRRRPRHAQRDDRRGRPLQHEALPEPDGQHRRRRPGPRDRPPGRSHHTRRAASQGDRGRAPRPGRADARDVRVARDRAGRGGGRDPDHADGLLPGGSVGRGRRGFGAGRALLALCWRLPSRGPR